MSDTVSIPAERIKKLLEYADSEYVPNSLFDEFRGYLTDPVRDQINGGVTQEARAVAEKATLYRCESCPEEMNCHPAGESYVVNGTVCCAECLWECDPSDRESAVSVSSLTTAQAEREQLDARLKTLEAALFDLKHDCMANDFNEHWDSYKAARAALQEQRP